MAGKSEAAVGSYCGSYKVVRHIASGNYGALFLGKHKSTNKEVAIKCEPKEERHPQLPLEYRFYGILRGVPRIPKILYFGPCSGHFHGMVMDLLGPSVENLFERCGRELSVKTTTQLALQFIDIFELMHGRGVIYRDVKPENFLLGLNGTPKANYLHVVDFGMAKEFRDEKTKQHIEYRQDKGFLGTARYASTNAHFNRELSRRDDLEAVGYILVYLMKGELPWQGIKCKSGSQRNKEIGEIKRKTSVESLCQNLPQEYRQYLHTVKALEFKEDPDYTKLKKMFKHLSDSLGDDNVYDWNEKRIHNVS